MLRRGAGDCYSRNSAICRDLGHIVQFTRMPRERLRSCGFSAEFFPQFDGGGRRHEQPRAIAPPRKNPDAAARVLKSLIAMSRFCLWFAATLSQDI
jgi:hypothetical protein